jgi:hypothetical protein
MVACPAAPVWVLQMLVTVAVREALLTLAQTQLLGAVVPEVPLIRLPQALTERPPIMDYLLARRALNRPILEMVAFPLLTPEIMPVLEL